MRGVLAEPMIYLRDLRVEVGRARDLRSVSVTVLDNDHMPDGEHPAVAGARVRLYGRGEEMLAEASTPESGRVAFATPGDVSDAEMSVKIEHPKFNWRALRLNGTAIAPDIRKVLYGELAKS